MSRSTGWPACGPARTLVDQLRVALLPGNAGALRACTKSDEHQASPPNGTKKSNAETRVTTAASPSILKRRLGEEAAGTQAGSLPRVTPAPQVTAPPV